MEKFLCLDFINSSWYITHESFEDPLRNGPWLIQLAKHWCISPLSCPTPKETTALIDMRSQLTALLRKIMHSEKPEKREVEWLNRYMVQTSFCKQLVYENGSYIFRSIPRTPDWNWFMSEVAASFAVLYTSNDLNNLKACQDPGCIWFFIDESKSGNRKWCCDTCASRMKVRKFRQKQKEKNE